MTDQPPTLESLAFDWGDAYLISYARDRWAALRRDTGRFLIADTLTGLEHAIQDDYLHDPVPRESDPLGTADYLSQPDQGPDEELDEDDAPDEETLTVLRELRMVFPTWTITYSGQMRSWIARTGQKTICESSAVLLCVALALIERRQGQANLGPDCDGSSSDDGRASS